MDRERFDALARLLAVSGSRRGAIGAVFSVVLLGQSPHVLAGRHNGRARGKGKPRQRDNDHQGRDRAGSTSEPTSGVASEDEGARARESSTGRGGAAARQRANAHSEGRRGSDRKGKGKSPRERCFDGGPCLPAPRANLQRCNFTDSNALANANCTQCNLQGASLRGANAANANFTKANLSRACLVEADLRGATIAGTTNLRGAIFCRTTMPDGSVDNSGCERGTSCCPTCIGIGGACGDAGGACCGGATCQGGRCTCPADKPANCGGVCRACCARGDCPAQECRTADCIGQGTCKYTAVPDNRSGPLCPAPRVCCDGGCCASGQVCDTRGDGAVCCTPESAEETCNPSGRQPRCGQTPNNCGDPVDCGPCDEVVCNTGACRNRLHICQYTPVDDLTRCNTDAIANGICCDGRCEDGNCCDNATCRGSSNTCTDNTCRCGAGAACTFPNPTCCGASPGGTCVDTERDSNNCGRCGNRCARNNVCSDDPPRCCQPPGIFCSYVFGLQRRCCSSNCKPFPFAPIGIGTCQ